MQTSVLENISAAECDALAASPYGSSFTVDAQGEIHSVHKEKFDTTGPTFPNTVEIPATSLVTDEKNSKVQATFKLDTSYKFLNQSTVGLPTPALALKRAYKHTFRFRWVKNIVYKVCRIASFRSSIVTVNALRPYDQEVLYENMIPASHKPGLERDMGHTSVCEDWVSAIEATTLYAQQCFGYSLGTCKAWPLHEQTDPAQFYHQFQFNLAVMQFIEMRRYDEVKAKWVKHIPDASLFENMPVTFSCPRFFCNVSDVAPLEMRAHNASKPNTYWIFDMVRCEPTPNINTYSPGVSVVTQIAAGGLCLAVFWSLENITYKAYNKTHNYTCRYDDESSHAVSSIHTCSYLTSFGPKFKNLPAQMLEGQATPRVFPCSSAKVGICKRADVAYVGIENNGGSIPEAIGGNIANTISSNAPKKAKFKPRVRKLVLRKCTFEGGKLTII